MIEAIMDGVELSTEFLDDLFVAIRDKLPSDRWVPITKDHQRVLAGLKLIIDCRCYGENFDVALHEEMTHFKKISGFQPLYNTAKPISNHPPSYWTEQDAIKLENDKREYLKAQEAMKRELMRERTPSKKRRR